MFKEAEKEVTRLGYDFVSSRSYGERGITATYYNDGIALILTKPNNGGGIMAELSCMVSLITLTTSAFSFPHSKFEMFEREIRAAATGARVYVNVANQSGKATGIKLGDLAR